MQTFERYGGRDTQQANGIEKSGRCDHTPKSIKVTKGWQGRESFVNRLILDSASWICGRKSSAILVTWFILSSSKGMNSSRYAAHKEIWNVSFYSFYLCMRLIHNAENMCLPRWPELSFTSTVPGLYKVSEQTNVTETISRPMLSLDMAAGSALITQYIHTVITQRRDITRASAVDLEVVFSAVPHSPSGLKQSINTERQENWCKMWFFQFLWTTISLNPLPKCLYFPISFFFPREIWTDISWCQIWCQKWN